jgi:hypothetical protein
VTTSQPHHTGPQAALAALGAQLGRDDFDTMLNGDDGPPVLIVASRHAQLSEHIYADGQCYWWPWGQPIASAGNPKAAAAKISYLLSAAPGHAHG